jgi:hypothetical protein
MLLNDQVVPTTKDQGATNEPISKVITIDMALPVSYCVGAKIQVQGFARGNSRGSLKLYTSLFRTAKM